MPIKRGANKKVVYAVCEDPGRSALSLRKIDEAGASARVLASGTLAACRSWLVREILRKASCLLEVEKALAPLEHRGSVGLSDQLTELAEELMRGWVACCENPSPTQLTLEAYSLATKSLLTSLGMEWDVGHGYVFPWTDMENGPFPMTGSKGGRR